LPKSVNRNSPIPYYVQVADALRESIEQGVWQPGEQIPGELELCRMFDVSRTVIRQTLRELIDQRLIVRRKGKGTFVADPKIKEGLFQSLTGFYQDMVEQGFVPVSRVLKQAVVPASPTIAAQLEIEPETLVIEIERLRFIEDKPIVLVTTYLPYTICAKILEEDLAHQSLYAVLEKRCGLFIARGHRVLEAVSAQDYEAHLLNIQPGSPLIKLHSVSYLDDGTPIECYHAFHRADRSRFEVELVRVHQQDDMREVLSGEVARLPRSNRLTQIVGNKEDKS
jgi:GntR family transcriptional regulator